MTVRGRVRTWVSTVFDPQVFLATLAFALFATLFGGIIPIIGGWSGIIGIAAFAFLLGATGRTVYMEVGAAGAIAAGVVAVLDPLSLIVGLGPLLVVATMGLGVAAGVSGHYLGRDLNAGLTRPV